jgi:putative nucleotidyltransferase with HDIG domain
MNIPEAIKEYKEAIIEAERLNEDLFTKMDMDSWIKTLHKRAERLSTLYEKSNGLLDLITKEINNVMGKDMDDAFEALYDLYLDGFDDAPLMIPILKRMEEYYGETKNFERMIVSYSIHAYESHEYISRLDPTIPIKMEQYKAILNLKDHYKEVERPRVRWNYFVAYYNFIVASEYLVGVSPSEVYDYLVEAEELWQREDVQALDGDNEEVKETVDEIKRGFLIYSERYPDLTPFLKEEIYQRSLVYLDKEDINKTPVVPFLAYSRCMFERGEITKEELLASIESFFKPSMEHFFDTELDDQRITEAFEIIGTIMKCLSLKGDANVGYYCGEIKNFVRKIEAKTKVKRMTPYINTVIAGFVVSSLPFEDNKEEIEQSLFDNLIRRQAPTYIHSVMVMKIAETIYEYMYKSLLPKMENPLEFIQNGALLHDIGKSMITDIINMQRRKLSDEEFKGIRNHPTFGKDIIRENPLLEEYHDIILGHHKWYNGLGGYPADFDNTKSKYKIIIDLITIADCLDAATGKFGRNYKRPKSVKDVLAEFEKGSGTIYSPYFTNSIKENKELEYKLEQLKEYKRPEYMYRAYIKGKIGE